HDLVRAYATEVAQATDPADARHAARHRMLDHYLHTARAAALLLDPQWPLDPPTTSGKVTAEYLHGYGEAMAWFTPEHSTLMAFVHLSAELGRAEHAWHLALGMEPYLARSGHWDDLITTQTLAVELSRQLDDPVVEACAHNSLGRAYNISCNYQNAGSHLFRARQMFAAVGVRRGEASSQLNLAILASREGHSWDAVDRYHKALDMYDDLGDRAGQASAMYNLSHEYSQSNNLDKA